MSIDRLNTEFWQMLKNPQFARSSSGVAIAENWQDLIIVDRDAPELVAKASRDRRFRSENSEDVLTWNFARSVQKTGRLDLLSVSLEPGDAQMCFWSRGSANLMDNLSATLNEIEAEHFARGFQQSEMDALIHQEPALVAVEAKLVPPYRTVRGAWGGKDTLRKWKAFYRGPAEELSVFREMEASVLWTDAYQLMRHVVIASSLAPRIGAERVVLLVIWNGVGPTAALLARTFEQFAEVVDESRVILEQATWQDLRDRLPASFEALQTYLSFHPCL